MLDFDLAEMYEVETRALNQPVKPGIDRFPNDFIFQPSKPERQSLSQIVMQCRLVNKYKMERGSNGSASWRTRIKTVYYTRNPRKSALLASALSAFKSLTKRH